MPDYLALDRESHQLSGLEASVGKGSLRLRKAFTLALPTDEELAEREQKPGLLNAKQEMAPADRARLLGEWLKVELKEQRISTKQVLLCLPREQTVVRQLEVPDVDERELPEIVRLQAETKISGSLDQLLLDFLLQPKRAGAATREVLTATVSREFVDSATSLLKTADLEPVSIGVSSVATAELVVRAEDSRGIPPGEVSLLLARHGSRLEISLVRDRCLLFAHAARLSVDSEQQAIQSTLAEVSRSFMAMQRVLGDEKVARAWVVGPADSTTELCEALQHRLTCDVFPLEPVTEFDLKVDQGAEVANQSQFAGPLGMLLAKSDAQTPQLDFLNPRKSVQRMDEKKRRIILAAATVAAVYLIAVVSSFVYGKSLDGQIEGKQRELADLNQQITAGKPTQSAHNEIAVWDKHDVNTLDEKRRMFQAFPGTHRVYLRDLRFTGGSGKKGTLRITAKGFAKTSDDIAVLKGRLRDAGFQVPDRGEKQTGKDPTYPWEFPLALEPDQKARQKPAPKAKTQ